MAQPTASNPNPVFTLADRLEHGNLTIPEVLELANVSKTKFYADAKAGLVSIDKFGAKSIVRGPVAKFYIQGSRR